MTPSLQSHTEAHCLLSLGRGSPADGWTPLVAPPEVAGHLLVFGPLAARLPGPGGLIIVSIFEAQEDKYCLSLSPFPFLGDLRSGGGAEDVLPQSPRPASRRVRSFSKASTLAIRALSSPKLPSHPRHVWALVARLAS